MSKRNLRNYIHGGYGTKLYRVWGGLRNRCTNPNNKNYPTYGGRGVKVYEPWNEFVTFKMWALSEGYKEGLSIDRIDNSGDYCPENCRWITRSENTTKRNIERRGISDETVREIRRMSDKGWSHRNIAAEVGIGKTSVGYILIGKRYKDVV